MDPVYAGLFDPQQWNRYAYARNNPLSYVDPDGRQALLCGGRPCFGTQIVWFTAGPVPSPPPGALQSGGDPGFLMGSYLGNVWEHDIGDSPGSYYVPPVLQGLTDETTTDPIMTTTTITTATVTTTATTGSTTTSGPSGAAAQPGGTRSSRPRGITVFAGGCFSGGLALGGQGCAGGLVGGRYGSPGSVGRYLSGEVSGGNRTIGIGLQFGFLRGSPDQFAGTAVPYTLSLGPLAFSYSFSRSVDSLSVQVFPVLLPSPFNFGTAAGTSKTVVTTAGWMPVWW